MIAGFFNRLISGFLSFRANRSNDVTALAFRVLLFGLSLCGGDIFCYGWRWRDLSILKFKLEPIRGD